MSARQHNTRSDLQVTSCRKHKIRTALQYVEKLLTTQHYCAAIGNQEKMAHTRKPWL
jgi:hypothetical protein